MPLVEKFIVIPYRKTRGGAQPGELRQASSADGAVRIATAMSDRVAGVAAYAVLVDTETGDMTAPRQLVVFGSTAELIAD